MFIDQEAEAPSKDTLEKREDSDEVQQDGAEGTTERPRPQAFPEQESSLMGDTQSLGEDTVTNTQPPATLPSQERVDPQATEDSERGPRAQQPARKAKQEEEEEGEAGEKSGLDGVPTAAPSSDLQAGYKEIQKDDGMFGDRDLT